MNSRANCIIALTSVVLACSACGGSATPVAAPLADELAAPYSSSGNEAGLPLLAELPAPARGASLQGPGWLELHPKSTVARVGGQPSLPDEIVLEADGQTAYAIYGVRNFDGNCFPTSIRLELANVTGEYYIGFSDYVAGNWRFTHQWTGSATIELPDIDDYASPLAYTSQQGWHYFAIVIPAGGGMTITGVEVGIHGGNLGPARPVSFFCDGGENGLTVGWRHSVDYLRPDFAGYLLERAPWLEGSFTRLTPQPIMATIFLDEAAEVGNSYRYRVAAIDTSGNLSAWHTEVFSPLAGDLASPIVVVDAPRGPLYAPAEVTFDLSGSFDPEGEGFAGFGLSIFGSPVNYIGPNPTIMVTLQPGCYFVDAMFSAGARTGHASFPLVVYPRWQDESVVVREPDLDNWLSRLNLMRGGRLQPDGRMVLLGYDNTISSAALWCERPAGDGFDLTVMPAYGNPAVASPPIEYIGEPVAEGGQLFFPVCASDIFMLLRFDGESAEWLIGWHRVNRPYVAAAGDGGNNVWLFFESEDAGVQQLAAITPNNTTEMYVVVPDLHDSLMSVDAVYNPDSGLIDIVYVCEDAGSDFVRWVSWDPVAHVSGTSVPITGGLSCVNADIELNPVTSRPAVVVARDNGADQNNVFSEQIDLAAWSVPEVIDGSGVNREFVDFVYSGAEPYVYFTLNPGTSQLYERDGGIWSSRNSPGLPDSGWDVVLLDDPGSDDLVAIDRDFDGNIFIDNLHADGTDTLRGWSFTGTEGQGFELHGVAGADGLHTIWRCPLNSMVRHYMSADGSEWTDAGNLPGLPRSLDLSVTADGEVYCSYSDNLTAIARLQWWDGAAFVTQATVDQSSPAYRSFLSHDLFQENLVWVVDQNLPPHTIHYYEGNADDGFIDFAVELEDYPIWTGSYLNSTIALDAQIVAVAGGATADDASVGTFELYGAELTPWIEQFMTYPLNFFVTREAWGRNIAGSQYIENSLGLVSQVQWLSHGTFHHPLRYETKYPLVGDPETTQLPLYSDYFAVDGRRTVSAATAWGPSAVGLIASLDGRESYIEWSNFGDWEELKLPDLEYMTMPELIVGRDGRWHIVYKNYLTDQMMCRSTR